MLTNRQHNEMSPRKRVSPFLWVPTTSFFEGLAYITAMVIPVLLYKLMGLPNERITFLVAWLYLPLVLKPFWEPLTRQIFPLRRWVLVAQFTISLLFALLAYVLPSLLWLQASFLAFWWMAFAYALHHTYYNDLFSRAIVEESRPVMVSLRTLFYTFASVALLGLVLMVIGNLQVIYRNSLSYSWSLSFFVLAGLCLLMWLWHLLILPWGRSGRMIYPDWDKALIEIRDGLNDIVSARGSFLAIVFVLLFVVPEAMLSKTTLLFLIDTERNGGLGLSPQEFALVEGTVGMLSYMLGIAFAGTFVNRYGVRQLLPLMALALTLPALLLWWLSTTPVGGLFLPSIIMAVFHLGVGFGMSGYLHSLQHHIGTDSRGVRNWAEALMAFSQMIVVMLSGTLQTSIGYASFFSIAPLLGLLTVAVAFLFSRQHR